MIRGLIGKKLGMTQHFNKEGNVFPVTVVEAGPCTILEILESPLRIKLGYAPLKESKVSKPQQGYFKKIGVSPMKIVKEMESSDNKDYKVGQEIKAEIFRPGDFVDVTGTSIGKGFQGGMKRWGWSGGPATHGSMHHRRVGSISSSEDPSRVFRGRHMPGHMGAVTRTVQSLRVMDIDLEQNILLIKGAIPGYKNGVVVINLALKKKFRELDEQKPVVEQKKNPMKQSKAKAAGKGK
ncbi:MAG: 50S ribosomal protein L3 [Candidatus Omnitrophota bacterium]|nr:50S ribosomal protein L3 [Candidatus Omnitrophota bacterium]